MITQSGHFDDNLNEFYDYEKYGKWRMDQEQGRFVNGGYVSYHGFVSMEEELSGSRSERLEMTMGECDMLKLHFTRDGAYDDEYLELPATPADIGEVMARLDETSTEAPSATSGTSETT